MSSEVCKIKEPGAISDLEKAIEKCLDRANFVRGGAVTVGVRLIGYSHVDKAGLAVPTPAGIINEFRARVNEIIECIEEINQVLEDLR